MKKISKLLALVLALSMLLCTACALADGAVDSPDASNVVKAPLSPKAEEYLKDKFDVELGDSSAPAINAALESLGAPATDVTEGDVTPAKLAKSAVALAGMTELAEAYTNEENPELAAALLDKAGVNYEGVDEADLPYLAAAVELGLVDPAADMSAPVTTEAAANMLYRSLEIAGKGRHYIGTIQDGDILEKLREVMDSLIIFDDPTLTKVGEEIVMQGATTGYNLKYAGYDADFLDEYTLRYGHSSYVHAQQLVSLLKSADFNGFIQIEPKVSVYEHLAEWGAPGAATPTSETRTLDNERMLTYAVEYDMMIEFENAEQKQAFNSIIETYAKKYDDDYDENGQLKSKLLKGAWWQPLYSSTVPVEGDDYKELVNNKVYNEDGTFYIQSFSTAENADAVAGVVSQVAPELTTTNETLYANNAFYRYITGESHQ